MARVNSERFLTAAATATSAADAPDPTLCPRCQRPLMDPFGLGLCSACGYCHSLQSSRTHIQLEAKKDEPARKARLGKWQQVLQHLPDGMMVPVGGGLGLLAVTLFISAALPISASLRWNLGRAEMLLGFIACWVAHYLAHRFLSGDQKQTPPPEEPTARTPAVNKKLSLLAVLEIWRSILAQMPRMQWYLAGLTWGASLILGGFVLVLPYRGSGREQQNELHKLDAEAKAKVKREEEKKKERQFTSERLTQLKGQPGLPGYTPKPVPTNPRPVQPGDPIVKKPLPAPDLRASLPCVILGYVTNSSKQLTGLVLGTAREGQVVFAGVIEDLDVDQRVMLELKLANLRRSEPLFEIAGIKAVWVKPTVYCEVHQSGVNEAGKLEQPRFRALIEE